MKINDECVDLLRELDKIVTSNLEGSKVKITTKKWLTPNGDWINKTGIDPTIRVTLKDKYYENPIKDNDNQLTTAIKVMSEQK